MAKREVAVVTDDHRLSTKRGLDLSKVDFLLGREQERDLALIYRIDQLKLFKTESEREGQYNCNRQNADTPVINAIWEAHDNYMECKAEKDQRGAIGWYKELASRLSEAQAIRREAMDRLFDWKKQAEAKGGKMDDMTQIELEKLANG